MLIGELSAKSGLSRDTIRFYEKQGLIKVGRKQRRDNNYKEYPDEALNKLLTVKRIKNFGFTLNEAADILSMIEVDEATCENVNHLIDQKIHLLDTKIQDLITLRTQLLTSFQKCKACSNPAKPEDNCPILVSDNF